MSEEKPIWKRIPYERDKQYSLFCIYRDLGPTRSHEKVQVKFSETSGESVTLRWVHELSSKYNWVERASAYDDYVDARQVESNLQAIEEMNKRQAKDAITIQEKAMKQLNEKLPLADTKASPEQRRNAIARTWEIGVKNERLARGASTEKIEQSGKVKQEHSGKIEGESFVNEFNRIMDKALKNLDEPTQQDK